MLKDELQSRFSTIHSAGVNTLEDLIGVLKSKPKVEDFSKKTGLSIDYLTLLKREASSYLPNPVPLNKFPGVNTQAISKLEETGIKNSKQLFDKAVEIEDRKALSSESSVSEADLNELVNLSDLSRLYGVGPVFARMLYNIGIDSVKSFIHHSAEEIIKIYEDINKKKADFTLSDIQFTLEMARELDLIIGNGV
jgi:nucleotidyltransferase/DNA polymerase involved in DNA repair